MKAEIWDIIDQNGNKTGKTTVRGRFNLNPGEYHLVVHIWVISSDGKILIQKRSKHKKLMPGEWAATGGAAISGESSFQAASRELFEELSIESNEKTLKKFFRLKRRNSFLDVYLIKAEPTPESLTLQESEVAEVKWVSPEELRSMIEKREYHNYGREYFKTIFDEMFNSMQELMKSSGDSVVKNQFVGYANNLTTYFNEMASNLSKVQEDINSEIKVNLPRLT